MIGRFRAFSRRRAGGYFVIGLLAGLAAILVIAPFLVPVERVRVGIARIFSSYAGVDIRVEGSARARLFPQMRVEFRNFAVKDATGAATLMVADRVDVSVDVLQYLMGRSPVASVTIRHPTLSVSSTSLLGDMLTKKRLARLRPANLTLEDAEVTLETPTGPVKLDNLDLTLAWPRQTAPVRFASTFNLAGEAVSMSGQGMGPAALASGNSGDISISATSSLARVAFAGKAVLLDQIQLDGALSASMNRPTGMIRLLTGQPETDMDISRIDMDGRLRVVGQQAILSDASVRLGNARAEGFLSAQWDGKRPQIRGTVDFATVTLPVEEFPSVAHTFSDLLTHPGTLKLADLDLRLSLARLETGLIRFGQVATTLIVKDGRLDGQFVEADPRSDGSISSHFTAEPDPAGTRLAATFSLTDVALPSLLAKWGWPMMTSGTLTGEASFNTVVSEAPDAASTFRGRVDGHLAQVRMNFPEASAQPNGTSAAADTSLRRFDDIDLGLEFSRDSLWIDRCKALIGPRTLMLTGSVDLEHQTLQLGGTESNGESSLTLPLSIAGPLTAPILGRGAPLPVPTAP